MENESDLPGDDGVEEDPQDDTADLANDETNTAVNKDEAGKAKPVAKGAKKKYPKKARKAIKKKPDDMPRRPLSAYNYFFSDMRTKLLADRAGGNDELFRDFMASEGKAADDVSKKNGFFSNMGKFVAQRWKSLQGTDEIKIYVGMAEKDLARYRKEMDEYREGVARKTRLASEQKLRDDDVDVSHAVMGQVGTGAVPNMVASAGGGATNQPAWPSSWLAGQAGGGAATGGAQFMPGAADPQLQMLLRQQFLAAQNPQLNAFLLQQQFAAAGGMPGFAPQFAQFYGQQPQQDMMMMGGGGVGFQGMPQNADLFPYNFGAMYPQQTQPQQTQPGTGGDDTGTSMPAEQDGGQLMAQQQQQQSPQVGQGGQDVGNESLM